MVDLSVVVLHFNRWDLTKDCLASIDAQDIPCRYEKVLVDHGSEGPLFPSTIAVATGWRVVRYGDNRGHIVGQNRCFESARGTWVLFVANDVRFKRGLAAASSLAHLWQIGTQLDRVGQIQPVCWTTEGRIDQAGMDWRWPGYGLSRRTIRDPVTPVPIVPSTCYLMRKAVWRQLRGFDETLPSSHEDVDMGLRLRQAGFRNYCLRDAWAHHLGNATLRYTLPHPRQVFHQARMAVIKKQYGGLDRALRVAAVCLLDAIPRPLRTSSRGCNHSSPGIADNPCNTLPALRTPGTSASHP